MTDNVPIELLSESKADSSQRADAEAIGLELDIFGESLNFQIAVKKNANARLSDIVPVAREISTIISETVIKTVQQDGYNVPCSQGCANCCNYLISLSVPEVFRLREEIFATTDYQKRQILRSFLLVARRILKHKTSAFFNQQSQINNSPDSQEDMTYLSNWYKDLNLQCPFLFSKMCTAYESRPFVCREHFVTGSSKACRQKRSHSQLIQTPVKMSEVLTQLTSELEGSEPQAVIMPLIFAWYDTNEKRDQKEFSAEKIVANFVKITKQIAKQNCNALTLAN